MTIVYNRIPKDFEDMTLQEAWDSATKLVDGQHESMKDAYHFGHNWDLLAVSCFLENAINGGALSYNSYRKGLQLGTLILRWHKTLQGCLVNLMLGIMVMLAKEEFVDARNEQAIKTCQVIRAGINNYSIKTQPFI